MANLNLRKNDSLYFELQEESGPKYYRTLIGVATRKYFDTIRLKEPFSEPAAD